MRLGKKISILTAILSIFGYQLKAGGVIVPPTSFSMSIVEEENTQNFFIDANIGLSSVNINSKISDAHFLSNALDDNGLLFDIGIGYRLNQNWFMEVSAQNTSLDYLSITNLYGSLNYQLTGDYLSPYIGLVVGHCDLKWARAPLDNSNYLLEDRNADEYFYGGQIGVEYEVSEKISINISYQHLLDKEKIVTWINGAELTHENQDNLMIGVRYAF